MASDNNMDDILVERILGSQEAYVSYANDMLKRMGLSRTHVADPSGFDAKTVSQLVLGYRARDAYGS